MKLILADEDRNANILHSEVLNQRVRFCDFIFLIFTVTFHISFGNFVMDF